MLSPDDARRLSVDGIDTLYFHLGSGSPVLLLHGSGPGVSAWANWRGILDDLAKEHEVVAMDLVGFGGSHADSPVDYGARTWARHAQALMSALDLERFSIIGNSMGGAIAARIAIESPERVDRLVLMGSAATHFELTEGLDCVWGCTPTLKDMKRAFDFFAYEEGRVSDEVLHGRLAEFQEPRVTKAYAAMFPPPRQRWVDEAASTPDELRGITAPTILIHGRDDEVVPLQASIDAHQLIRHSTLHSLGECGHWTQIEKRDIFVDLVADFLAG